MDYRYPGSVEHDVQTLLAQRVYGLALGYEDLNDHDALRPDSLLALLVGKSDLVGESRVRERDRGYPLARARSTVWSCMPQNAATHRYQKIAADPEAMWTVCSSMCSSSRLVGPGCHR